MRAGRSFGGMLGVAAACLAGAVGGCSRDIWITQYPSFWTPGLEKMRVAVVPFRNQTHDPTAADALSDELSNALRAAGTYRSVFNRGDLSAVMDQRDLQLALGGDNTALAEQFRKLSSLDVEAVLVGTVTMYVATSRSEQKPSAGATFRKLASTFSSMTHLLVGFRLYRTGRALTRSPAIAGTGPWELRGQSFMNRRLTREG